MKKLWVSLALLASVIFGQFMTPASASAAVDPGCNSSSSLLGLPTWYKYLDVGRKEIKDKDDNVIAIDQCAIKGPVDSNGKFDWALGGARIGLAIVDILLRLAAIIAVVFVLYGGVRYILSQGEPDQTKKARGTVINAVIGLVITMLATAAVNFLGNTLIK